MREEGIRGAFDRLVVEGGTVAPASEHRLGLNRLDTFPASELARKISSALHALTGHVWVELKGQPLELNLDAIRKALDCTAQALFADVAPRTDEVGGDADLDL